MSAVVIVGAGHAGGRAALALRAAGFEGTVTLLGEEPHPPYERPPLSKDVLAGTTAPKKTYIKPADAYDDLRLSVRVEEIDRAAGRVRLGSGETVAYDQLLLTTGARPRRLAVEGGEGRRVFYLRDLADAAKLRARLAAARKIVVVGAGLIGLEVAATARTMGVEVTVLEAGAAPLGRVVAPEIGAWFAARHEAQGVEIVTGVCVEGIVETGKGVHVVLAGGAKLAADCVAIGIGAVPNTELAQGAGLAVDDGVLVDAFGRTGDPAIFAAGDVARAFNPLLGRHMRLETWRNAQDQAAAVAKVVAGGAEPHAEIPWFWTDQFGFNVQMAGLPQTWDELVWRGSPDDPRFTVFYLERGRIVGALALNNARDIRQAGDLIRRGVTAPAAALADPAVKLADLAAEGALG